MTNNIFDVSPEQRWLSSLPGSFGRKVILRPEKKPVNWTTDVVSKFYKAKELILHPCVATLAIAKACLRLPQRRSFVTCEKDSMRFMESLSFLVEVFAW